jgi:hypothetical protein
MTKTTIVMITIAIVKILYLSQMRYHVAFPTCLIESKSKDLSDSCFMITFTLSKNQDYDDCIVLKNNLMVKGYFVGSANRGLDLYEISTPCRHFEKISGKVFEPCRRKRSVKPQ